MPLTARDIAEALAAPPLGARSDHDLNPGQPPRPGPQAPAAVLCGLVERPAGLQVVLTQRARHLRRHAGQIAFPGGRVDPGDPSLLAAALREADEEIGLGPDRVEVLGALDPYVTVTGFRVTPFVGMVDPRWRPLADPAEVEAVFETPLDFLMDPANCQCAAHEREGLTRRYYVFAWRGHRIWGATAGMLKSLADRLARLRAGQPGAAG